MISGHARKTAIVLGGTVPHIELIRQLKARSYYVVLADFLPNPPAKVHADEHVQISTLEKDDVLRLATERKTSLVISTCIDQANATACYVAEKLGLPRPYSYTTALNVTNKASMKRIMAENGIPTAKYVILGEEVSSSIDSLRYPLIVKPVDSNSSKGISRVNGINMLNKAIDLARSASRSGDVIVEEFIEGVEVGVDCFVADEEVNIAMVKERRKIHELNQIQQIYGCYWPMPGFEDLLPSLSSIVMKIAQAFNLKNTPLMLQAIIKGEEIFVIELAPRIGGGESFRIIKKLTGFDILSSAIDSWEMNKVEVSFSRPNIYYAENFIYTRSGIFARIVLRQETDSLYNLEYIDTYKESGTMIGEELTSNNRVGVFVVKSNTITNLKAKIRAVIDNIDVVDVSGISIFNRDLYHMEQI